MSEAKGNAAGRGCLNPVCLNKERTILTISWEIPSKPLEYLLVRVALCTWDFGSCQIVYTKYVLQKGLWAMLYQFDPRGAGG